MTRSHRVLSAIGTALLAIAVGTASFAELFSSARAMACCAKTHNQCAGLKSPDDCCRGMGHGVAAATFATTSKPATSTHAQIVVVKPMAPTPPLQLTTPIAATAVDGKRPHDPPHLHSAPLLI